MIKSLFSFLILTLFFVACSKEGEKAGEDAAKQPVSGQADAGPKKDVSNEALVKLDPKVQTYADAVISAKGSYSKNQNPNTKATLIKAYMDFGAYLTYESPLSPKQGKYHRAVIEFRKALLLDPSNERAKGEIGQIEDIYKSMGRPVPGDDASGTP